MAINRSFLRSLAATGALLAPALAPLHAGQPAPDWKGKMAEPATEVWFPGGYFTLGYKGAEHLQSGYLDFVTPVYKSGDFSFFYSSRTTYDDNSQLLGSNGLGVRYMFPDQEIILGANAFYDSIKSQHDNDFNQLGLGLELLSRWFDARVNWYIPDNSVYEISRSTETANSRSLGQVFRAGDLLQQRVTDTRESQTFRQYEGALKGFNFEAGFLVPGLDKYCELRLFAGYYSYDGPYGQDYSGFKARAELRLLPGLIADVEYWDDAELVGGNWVGGVRVEIPFAFLNVFRGRNIFEGTAAMFKPGPRPFRTRMDEMVMRSHRIQTAVSDPQPGGTSTNVSSTDVTVGTVPKPAPPRRRVTVGGGGGGEGTGGNEE